MTKEYDAFGNMESTSTTDTENPFKYCGEYVDEETGFVYLRNRYYDPSIGCFTTIDPAMDGVNWYVYCANNPVMLVDPEGLSSLNDIRAKVDLMGKAYQQYTWMIGASFISPKIGGVIFSRIAYSINVVEQNKNIINKTASAYKVRGDIIGAIIFKEQLTQSLPDSLANLDTRFFTGKTHSIGLGAINPGLARSAWQYVNMDVYNALPASNADLQTKLTDEDFNIQTIAASLRYIAGSFHNIDVEKLQDITDEQWKYILYDYNCGNSYNEKVMDYIPEIQEILN